MHDLKAFANQPRAPEQLYYFLGRCVGGDVKILGLEVGDCVAHPAADDIGLEAGLLQPFAGTHGGARNIGVVNAEVGGPIAMGFFAAPVAAFCAATAKHAADEITNHRISQTVA